VIVALAAVDMPCSTVPTPVALAIFSSISEAPTSATDSATMVPKAPSRMRMLLTYFGKLARLLSLATRVEASTLW